MTTSTFSDLREATIRFEEIMRKHGMAIPAGTFFSDLCHFALYLEQISTGNETINEMDDIRPQIAACAGLAEFIRLVVHTDEQRRLGPFVGHLGLVNTGNPSMTVAAPGRSTFTEPSNKLFELYLAMICSQFAEDVELAAVDDGTGLNPDVMCKFDERNWAFACKVPNGKSPLTLFERIEEGCDQIERSPATNGFVVISFRNLLDLNQFWAATNEAAWHAGREFPKFAVFADSTAAENSLRSRIDEVNQSFIDANSKKKIQEMFRKYPKVQPAVICFVQSVVPLVVGDQMKPVTKGMIGLMTFGDVPGFALVLVRKLNRVMASLFKV